MRRPLLLLGVVAFIVVDVVLIALAVRHVDGGAAADRPGPARPSPDRSVSESPPSEAVEAEVRRGRPLLMAAGAGEVVLRAQPGSCDGEAARLSVSRDGGASFEDREIAAQVLLRLDVTSLSDMWVAGLNADCEPTFYRSGDGGRSWEATAGTQGAWHLLPDGSDALHAPDGEVELPCTPVALSSVSFEFAAAGCDAGDIVTTSDRGESWQPRGTVPGVVDLAFVGPQRGWAVSVATDCAAVVSGTSDGGRSWTEQACVSSDAGRARAMARTDGGDLLVQVADRVYRSDDDGQTWQQE